MNRALPSRSPAALRWVALLLPVLFWAAGLPAAQTNDFLNDTSSGYWLAQNRGLGLWWCESGWKVGRDRAMPARPAGKPEPVASVIWKNLLRSLLTDYR